MNVILSENEIKILLNIANRAGCDRDGDLLEFYVQEDLNVVEVMPIHS